ncbi:MAG: hypothetical protein M8357_14715 [Desulfobulbaceae bacterium]|nr:hypothetical protein [Desulfobulbaceae bacterium]
MHSKKQTANLEVLKSIPPEDMRLIIQGCLGSWSAQADYKNYIKVYEFFVLEDKKLAEIAKLFKVSKGIIERKIDRLVSLVKRQPVIIDKLTADFDIFLMPITRLLLSDRALHALERAGVATVGDLLRRGENDLLMIRNFGRKTLNETKAVQRSLLAYLQSKSGQSEADAIEKLKVRSEEIVKGRAEWSLKDHEQLVRILTALEGRLTEAGSLVELILNSSPRHGRHIQQGFILPYHIWKQLWSWLESQRHSEKIVFDTPGKPEPLCRLAVEGEGQKEK